MTNEQDQIDLTDFEKPKLSSGLNVLTILTIIGCSFVAILTFLTPWLLSFSKKMMAKATESPDLTPEKMADMRKSLQAVELSEINMVPLIITGFLGIILCFIGALMMRKLKKDGYWLYLAGQLIPYISSGVILGMSQYQGIGSFIIPLVTLIFIILYTLQRKHLIY